MKKIICLALVAIMTVSLMISVSALVVDYTLAQDGDLLYEVDFGATGAYKFIDGRGTDWNLTGAQVSADGKSVTVEYTETVREGTMQGTGRARYSTEKISDFDVKGRAYTVQFTIDSAAYVGIALDGNTAFVINPSLNSTMVGQTHFMKSVAGEAKYDGTGASKQTYAIEMVGGTELTPNKSEKPAYVPTTYILYVLDEVNNEWRLVRDLEGNTTALNKFEWEDGYEYFYIAVTRYGVDEYNLDANGAAVKSTVSDMKIFRGIDFLTKGETAVIEPEEPEEEEEPEDATGNSGGSTTVVPKPSDKDSSNDANKKPAATEAATEAETESAEGGCGSVIAGASVALISAFAAGVAFKNRKNKED